MSTMAAFIRRLLPGRKPQLPRQFLAEVREALISRGFDVSEWSDEELWEAWFGFARIVATAGMEYQEALDMLRRAREHGGKRAQ